MSDLRVRIELGKSIGPAVIAAFAQHNASVDKHNEVLRKEHGEDVRLKPPRKIGQGTLTITDTGVNYTTRFGADKVTVNVERKLRGYQITAIRSGMEYDHHLDSVVASSTDNPEQVADQCRQTVESLVYNATH